MPSALLKRSADSTKLGPFPFDASDLVVRTGLMTNARSGDRPHAFLLGSLALASALVAACTPSPLETASDPAVETIPLHVLARDIESYRGQAVRTCGRWRGALRSAEGQVRAWHLSRIDPTSPHGFTASVLVPECRGRRPRLTDGCISGRVAREDGTLDMPDGVLVTDHLIISYEWWIHPQCEAQAR
jgi:hypothetical protein